MEHENFDDVMRENVPDEERTTNLDEPDQAKRFGSRRQSQRQARPTPGELPPPPQDSPDWPDPRGDDNAGRPPTPPDTW